MANTILLKRRGERKEAIGSGTILPGALLTINSSGLLTNHPTAGGPVAPLFAVENDLVGNTIDDEYGDGDYVQAEYGETGSERLAYLAAAATAVVTGDLLESAGDGSLRKHGTGTVLAQALESVDNSGGAEIARLKVVLL